MKRQVKWIVFLWAAVILTAGVSITSFAAGGWRQENGGWVYDGERGEKVTEQWIKSGENWFWLEDGGCMAADQLLEINGNYYYVGADGARVNSQWVAFENKNSLDDEEPDRYWYYFQENGKAYKRPDSASSGTVCAYEIGGKKYSFDTEARMLYGWVSDGQRQSRQDGWMSCDHYFGGQDDGVMRVGWERISIVDENTEKVQPGNNFWEKEQDRWFYFTGSGKKTKGKENGSIQKTLDGNQYRFDEFGRMIVSWYAAPQMITTELAKGNESYDSATAQGGKNYTKQFMYFGSPESGVQYSNAWFKAVPSLYLMAQKHEEGDAGMYYADDNGYLSANEIKTIDGQKYAFDNYGRQITGFVCLTMSSPRSSRDIDKKAHADDKSDSFSTVEEFVALVDTYSKEFSNHEKRFYLFYGQDNSMLTGNQKVTIGMEQYDFLFETEGYLKGSGVMGKKNGSLYLAGKQLKPEEGEKYAIYKQELNNYGMFYKMSVEDFIDENCDYGVYDEKKDRTVWKALEHPDNVYYYLVDSGGNIVKNKTNAKNMDGFGITVKDYKIQSITVEES